MKKLISILMFLANIALWGSEDKTEYLNTIAENNCNQQTKDQALIIATRDGELDIVKNLLELGRVNIDCQDYDRSKKTALMWSLEKIYYYKISHQRLLPESKENTKKFTEIAELLIQYGARLDLECANGMNGQAYLSRLNMIIKEGRLADRII